MTLEIGAPAPPFSLPGVDGRGHALDDYSDASALVLIQACNQCPYVQSWQGRIIDLQREFGERGVAIVAFNSNDENASPGESFKDMKNRAEAESFNFDYLHDEEQSLAQALEAERTPEVFVFDGKRRLVYHGAVDDSRDETAVTASYLRDALNATLEGRPPPVAVSEPQGCSIKWRA
jgi:peroxiredoxin